MADAQPEFIAAGGRKDQRRDINGEIGNLQPIGDIDRRERRSADEFIGIEKEEVDIKLVGPFGVGQAKVDAQLLMLKGKDCGSEMRKDADQALLSGGAVFNDAIADQESLDAGSMNAGHRFHDGGRTFNTGAAIQMKLHFGGRISAAGVGGEDDQPSDLRFHRPPASLTQDGCSASRFEHISE